MFNRRALYHLYKRSASSFRTGFRIADYINPKRWFNLFQGPITNTRPPAPSPLSSPIKGGPRHPQDDPPPTIHTADLFAGNGLGSPQRPSTPTADHPRNASPNVQNANVPVQDPLPVPPRRKGKYRPKHLSFSNGAIRPGLVPPHRRAQRLREKRETARWRIFDRHERRVVSVREWLDRLQRKVEALMKPEHMDEQDKMFLKQLRELQFDQVLKHGLDGETWEEQKRKMEAFVRAKEERSRRMEEAAMRADAERQRAHEAQERKIREKQSRLFRQELARKAKEEEERRRREGQERRIQEERERWRQEEIERKLREEAERLRREAHERYLCEERERLAREERERQARFLAEQARQAAREEKIRQYFVLYEYRWNKLRTSNSLPPVDVRAMPWPVFGVVSSADQITYQDVRTFLFYPQRPGIEGKTARDKIKSEMLRFHPDKFNARIVPKIQPSQRALAQEIAGAVVRILTGIMTEEEEQQK